ncbi:MAG: hypothetical protein J6Q82_08370 [Clostridia bacterium]|nr:hypothetical protein [Clostridia bacterium]
MKIRYYVKGILEEESFEQGIVLFVGVDKISMFNLISIDDKFLEPCIEKRFSLSNGRQIRIKISQSELFENTYLKMQQFEGMKIVEVVADDVKLEIEY